MNLMSILLQAPAAPGAPSMLMQLIPFVLIIVVFYFFMIRPQMKKQKELKNFRDSLQKGQKIVTNGGIYGKITDIQETTVSIEIAENVRVKIDKAAVIIDYSADVDKK
ncbi:MAG: preprotein translocase subunit YajC [Breznakibacter sp.]|nr:preprotein translocase subunit YajC [Breznakibacter sp.]